MQRLLLSWDPAHDVCDWLLLDQNGNRAGAIHRGEPLEALTGQPANELIWLVPGAQAIAVSAELPIRGREKILRALPFALEEHFASDPDTLFFALAAKNSGTRQQAVAVHRALLDAGLEKLAAHGLQARHIVPDYLTLPWTPGQWTVLADAGMLYVRDAEASGFAIEAELGWSLLQQRLERLGEEQKPGMLRYLRGREPFGPEPDLALLQADSESYTEGLLGIAPRTLVPPTQPAVELRQGDYSLHKDWLPHLKPWLPAGITVGVIVLLALAGFAANWYRTNQVRTLLAQRIHERFVQVLPNAGWQGESTARDIIAGRLRRSAGGSPHSGFLDLLSAIASASPPRAVKIRSLTFQPGTLQLQVHAPTVTALDDLTTRLKKHGVTARIGSANQTSSGVDGSLTVTATGGDL